MVLKDKKMKITNFLNTKRMQGLLSCNIDEQRRKSCSGGTRRGVIQREAAGEALDEVVEEVLKRVKVNEKTNKKKSIMKKLLSSSVWLRT